MESIENLHNRLQGMNSVKVLNEITAHLIELAESGFTLPDINTYTRMDIKRVFRYTNKNVDDILLSYDLAVAEYQSESSDAESNDKQNPELPTDHIVPDGYYVDGETGYTKRKGDELQRIPMCMGAMTVVKTGENIDDNTHWLTLRFNSIGARRNVDVHISYKGAMSRTGIMVVAESGLALSELDAGYMTKYIGKYLETNREHIEELAMANTCGWKGSSFVCGNRLFDRDGEVTQIQLTKDEVIKHMVKRGNRDDWFNGVRPMLQFDVPRFKLYAAMTAPLLHRYNLMSPIIHTCGDSGIGKSASDCMVSSAYGKPGNTGLQQRADGTAYSFELKAVASDGCILVLDETSGANAEIINRAIYNLSNGGSRGKGNVNHQLQKEESWNLVVLTTGETPILEGTEYTGQGVRIISINGCIDEKVDWIPAIEECIKNNHGFLIEDVIRRIQKDDGSIDKRYNEIYAKYECDDQTYNRRARTFAAFAVIGEIIDDIFSEYYKFDKSPEQLVIEMLDRTSDKSTQDAYYIRALDVLMQWLTVNRDYITPIKKDGSDMYSPTKRHLGYIDESYIYITQAEIKKALHESGMSFKSVRDAWVKHGIAMQTANGTDERGNQKYKFGKKIPFQTSWAGALDKKKICDVLNLEYEDDDEEEYVDDIWNNYETQKTVLVGNDKSMRSDIKCVRDEIKVYPTNHDGDKITETVLNDRVEKVYGIANDRCEGIVKILKRRGEIIELVKDTYQYIP